MGPIVFEAKTQDGRTLKIVAWASDNEPATDGCDAVIGYGIFQDGPDGFLDGGEMDCHDADHPDIADAAQDLAAYVSDDIIGQIASIVPTDEDPAPYEDNM